MSNSLCVCSLHLLCSQLASAALAVTRYYHAFYPCGFGAWTVVAEAVIAACTLTCLSQLAALLCVFAWWRIIKQCAMTSLMSNVISNTKLTAKTTTELMCFNQIFFWSVRLSILKLPSSWPSKGHLGSACQIWAKSAGHWGRFLETATQNCKYILYIHREP